MYEFLQLLSFTLTTQLHAHKLRKRERKREENECISAALLSDEISYTFSAVNVMERRVEERERQIIIEMVVLSFDFKFIHFGVICFHLLIIVSLSIGWGKEGERRKERKKISASSITCMIRPMSICVRLALMVSLVFWIGCASSMDYFRRQQTIITQVPNDWFSLLQDALQHSCVHVHIVSKTNHRQPIWQCSSIQSNQHTYAHTRAHAVSFFF